MIEPLVPVDLVIDHSVQVDFNNRNNALQLNMETEFERNESRYQFLKWCKQAFKSFSVVPPALILASAVPLVLQGQRQWSRQLERQWVRRHAQLIGSRQRLCHGLAFTLRRPGLSRCVLAAVERWPILASPLLHPFDGASLNPLVPEPCP
jgi:hypothetical protein